MAAPTAPVLGSKGFAYYNSNIDVNGLPNPAATNWVLMSTIKEVDFPIEYKETDVSSRLSTFEQMEPTQGKISGTLTFPVYDPANLAMNLFLRAAWARTPMDLLFLDMDQTAAGASYSGVWAQYKIFKAHRPEPVDGIMSQSFDLKLCWSIYGPRYIYLSAVYLPGALLGS